MSVFENVAYGLRARKIALPEITRRVDEALRAVRLEEFGPRNTRQLSGGQQQRVALARAMVIEPEILLMDEPLGALDKQLRKEVQLEIRRMHVSKPRTTLYVTHDQEEALVMSDRIAVMRGGRIEQIGTAQDLYAHPVNTFVARFLGESNLIGGRLAGSAGDVSALEAPGLAKPIEGCAAPGLQPGQAACALIRPENVRLRPGGYPARVAERVFLGEIVALRLALANGAEIWMRAFGADAPRSDAIEVGWERQVVSILPDVDG